MNESRRKFLGFGRAPEVERSTPELPRTPASADEFSLERFYAARGPQRLPPIVVKPTTLFYEVETTRVGMGPSQAEERSLDEESALSELRDEEVS
jgi:hypothetical protein